jgi:hypothetical protein
MSKGDSYNPFRNQDTQAQAWARPALERGKIKEPPLRQNDERCNLCRQIGVAPLTSPKRSLHKVAFLPQGSYRT